MLVPAFFPPPGVGSGRRCVSLPGLQLDDRDVDIVRDGADGMAGLPVRGCANVAQNAFHPLSAAFARGLIGVAGGLASIKPRLDLLK